MPSKNFTPGVEVSKGICKNSGNSVNNNDLIKDAGKISMDEPQPCGRGIINDFKRTVGTHWVEGMTNLNMKTISVTLLLFISVVAPTLTFGAVYGKVT
eukprot:CAMPEP_0116868588 /NCGR_PEP_ID=MMETSP0418-20121206/27280_1 /TAXON_ID=1158023 /ORGANISM="Astrosyne radiata, Strain 13vi08-1A" /LENGTH=97 /DNA_ID=CAMNT_0004504575 /DNA_START=85 /DNA_END=375 /DNA_ORIENTATION=-